MKVIFVEPFPDGAMLHIAHMLGNAMADRGHEVHLLGAKGSEVASLQRRYRAHDSFAMDRADRALAGRSGIGVRVRWFARRCLLAGSFLRQYAKAVATARRLKPDAVIVSTVFRYPLIGSLVRGFRASGAAVVQLCHEFEMREESPSLPDRLVRAMNRRAYDRFDLIVHLSRYQHDRFRETFEHLDRRILVHIPLGNQSIFEEFRDPEATAVYLEQLGASRDLQDYVLFFGRLRPDKGVEDLIEAYRAAVSDADDPPPLVLAGHARPSFRNRIGELSSYVDPPAQVFLGGEYVPSAAVWDLVRRARLMVLPYRSASQSAALQVAMTAGTAAIATDVGGLAESIRTDETGLVLPPGDVGALRDAIERLLHDPDLVLRLGSAAADHAATTFGWDRFAESLEGSLIRDSTSPNDYVETA